MTAHKCVGCSKDFASSRALGNHTRSCKKIEVQASKKLHEHQQRLAQIAEAKAKARRAQEEEEQREREERIAEEQRERDRIEAAKANDDAMDENAMPLDVPPARRQVQLPSRYRTGQFTLHKRAVPMPSYFRDQLPPQPPSIIPLPEVNSTTEQLAQPQEATTAVRPFKTSQDSCGIYRIYPFGQPLWTPDDLFSLSDVADSSNMAQEPSQASRPWYSPFGSSLTSIEESSRILHAPFPNISIFRLMSWYYGASNTKSLGELQLLVDNVILAPDFSQDHFNGFRASKEAKRMDDYDPSQDNALPFTADDRWMTSSVFISLPCDGVQHESEEAAPKLEIKGVYHRRLIEVIKAALSEPAAQKFHLFPFKSYWKPSPNEPDERIYGEAYTADFFLEQYEKLYRQPRKGRQAQMTPVMVGLMVYSDSTHLAQFGTASLWPIYIYFANESKYTRGKPSSFAAHHLAYVPKLGDTIQEEYYNIFGKLPTPAMLTFLRRELMQAIWLLLLDPEFMHAYIHGLELHFAEEEEFLFFPRFNSGSHDYPEKILMTCLKFLAQCPCPRCLILKSKIPRLGTKSDMQTRQRDMRVDSEALHFDIASARRKLFEDGLSISGPAIDRILAPKSMTPTRSAFSIRLFPHGLNFYQLYVPDLMHEFELGVFKAVFTHLVRILHADGNEGIAKLNFRQVCHHMYRNIPPFGQATIRRFHNNAAAMEKLAARDFEDLLQCAIPVFDGLLSNKEHDKIVRRLLFELATWHALAKLRLHTETTVTDLENSTTRLGEYLRQFETHVCPAYDTKELSSETAARGRRQSAKAAKEGQPPKGPTPLTKKSKKYNSHTYKGHSLGDVAKAIREHGTSDSYSSQTGELEHRRAKRFYPRVKKGHHTAGISKEVSRQRLIHRITQRNASVTRVEKPKVAGWKSKADLFSPTSPSVHYHISSDTRKKTRLSEFLSDNRDDPAVVNFHPRLLDHLLAQLTNQAPGHEFSTAERAAVVIENNTLFHHAALRVNYTTYDNRREQDTINPRTRPDVMVLSQINDTDPGSPNHPYLYGRVLAVLHARVCHNSPLAQSPEPQRMDMLFVRWFELDPKHKSGWKAQHLHRVKFVDGSDAFGFIDPSCVLRGIHLMPAFRYDSTTEILGPSEIARLYQDGDEDWAFHYVGMFADRDLVMRFRGGGVGHTSTRKGTDTFKQDRHKLDVDRRGTRDFTYDIPEDITEPRIASESGEAMEVDKTSNHSDSDEEDGETSEDDDEEEDVEEEDERASDDDGNVDDEREILGYSAL